MAIGSERWLESAEYLEIVPRGRFGNSRPLTGLSTAPGPARIVVDAAGPTWIRTVLGDYSASKYAPHITLDIENRQVYQHITFDKAAEMSSASGIDPVLAPHRVGRTVWVMLCKNEAEKMTPQNSQWVGEIVGKIAKALSIPGPTLPFASPNEIQFVRMALGVWDTFSGVCGACHVPSISRSGPGLLDYAIFLRGFNSILSADGVPHLASIITEKELTEIVNLVPEVILLSVEEPLPTPEKKILPGLGKFRGRTMKRGSSGKAVAELRAALGIEPGSFDNELEELIKEKQSLLGLEPDGVVERETWDALRELLGAIPAEGE